MITARIKRKKYSFYAFDVESHNDKESIEKGETSVWLGSLINDENTKDDENSFIYSIEEFLEKCEYLVSPKRKNKNQSRPIKNVCCYIYNLSFEWSFILPVLLKQGYTYKAKIEDNDEKVFNSISTRSVSSVWQVNIKINKNSGNLMLRDLAKIFGGGLGQVAESFGLPTQKGSINYTKNRLHNYVVTKKEKDYCFDDTRIEIDILLEMLKRADKDFFNANSASSYAMLKLIKTGWPHAFRPYQEYRKLYPALGAEETDFLRKGVAGGITYAPSLWQFKDIKGKILHIDAHQMHPTQAYTHAFAYGEGEYFTGKPKNSVMKQNCCRIKISYTGVKLHSIIELIGIDFIEDYELTVWDFEIPTMKKVYENLTIQYIDGYSYKTKPLPWREFYANNYKDRLIAKHKKDQFGIMFYKLLNNSSYGKLLEKPHNEIYENCLNADGIITSKVIQKDISELEVNAKYTYLPVGSAIPAWSRVCLIETALLFGWQKILYFDTDSIFCLYDEETKKIWESNLINKEDFLGGWGLEEIIDRAQFAAPKRYKLEVDGRTTVKMAGVNFRKASQVNESDEIIEEDTNSDILDWNYDNINIVNSEWEVKRAFRVRGGTIIDVQRKEISIQEKYKAIANKNLEK